MRRYSCETDEVHSSNIQSVRKKFPSQQTVEKLSTFFKMFSDEIRLKILLALSKKELCVCDLAQFLSISKSLVSHQLRKLRQENLVRFRKEGKNVYYSLADDHVKLALEMGLEHIEEKGENSGKEI